MSANARSGPARPVARIDEAQCVGCTLCIQACPFDAIVGAHHLMHTVVASLCTGCKLCIPPCPVDCIALVPTSGEDAHWDRTRAVAARKRRKARSARLERDQAERAARLARRSLAVSRS
ncbi:MAG: RnfABCDGE type electron transport complex subunit B [Betaproteobacteria bacterium]|nr:RnfABCDGE type electron transport complex subunit B [Betaproteobacteria bacterium]